MSLLPNCASILSILSLVASQKQGKSELKSVEIAGLLGLLGVLINCNSAAPPRSSATQPASSRVQARCLSLSLPRSTPSSAPKVDARRDNKLRVYPVIVVRAFETRRRSSPPRAHSWWCDDEDRHGHQEGPKRTNGAFGHFPDRLPETERGTHEHKYILEYHARCSPALE